MNYWKPFCPFFLKPRRMRSQKRSQGSRWWADPMWGNRRWSMPFSVNNDSLSAIFQERPAIQLIQWSVFMDDGISLQIRQVSDEGGGLSVELKACLLYTSPSPRDGLLYR